MGGRPWNMDGQNPAQNRSSRREVVKVRPRRRASERKRKYSRVNTKGARKRRASGVQCRSDVLLILQLQVSMVVPLRVECLFDASKLKNRGALKWKQKLFFTKASMPFYSAQLQRDTSWPGAP